MASFVAQLGNFDFANYVRAQPGDGLDPYSTSYEEPAFTDALGDGQPLLTVSTKNREMAWPLYLSSSSKDALHALVRQATLACKQAPLTLQWRDTDATNITYYDVTYARFEPNYDYWRSHSEILAGTLRVWCSPPHGHTGTYVTLGTALSPTMTPWLASIALAAVGGDTPGLLGASLLSATRTISRDRPFFSFVAVVPVGYQVVVPAASLGGAATLVGASGTGGSQVARYNANGGVIGGAVSVPGFMPGPIRTLVLARPAASGPGVWMSAVNSWSGEPMGPTVMLGATRANEWSLIDVGITTFAGLAVTEGAAITLGHASGASAGVEVNGIFYLPEGTMCLTPDSYVRPSGAASGLTGSAAAQHYYAGATGPNHWFYGVGAWGPYYIDHKRRGQLPRAAPNTSQAVVAGMIHTGVVQQDARVNVAISVREQFTFAR